MANGFNILSSVLKAPLIQIKRESEPFGLGVSLIHTRPERQPFFDSKPSNAVQPDTLKVDWLWSPGYQDRPLKVTDIKRDNTANCPSVLIGTSRIRGNLVLHETM